MGDILVGNNDLIDSLMTSNTPKELREVLEITQGEIKVVTEDYQITNDDGTVIIDASNNTVTATLPAIPTEGKTWNIKCKDATFTSVIGLNGKNLDLESGDAEIFELENFQIQADNTGNYILL